MSEHVHANEVFSQNGTRLCGDCGNPWPYLTRLGEPEPAPDLATWFRDQLDLDGDEWTFRSLDGATLDGIESVAGWQVRAYVERALAEIDAKRKLLDLHAPQPTGPTWDPGPLQCQHCAAQCHSFSGVNCDSPDAPYPCPTVRLVVLPYADRPGYREEWRP